jgi:hypothetical protein
MPTEYAGKGINTDYFRVLCKASRQKNARRERPGIRCAWMVLELRSIVVTITIAVVLHVVHGAAIAFLEAIAELTAVMFVDRRVFVHLVIVCIGTAMVHIVATCRFNAFTEALALRVTITIRRAIPITITIAVLVLILRLRRAVLRRARWWWWRFLGGGLDGCGRSHAEGKSGN